jgi:hypothetical protein
MIFGIFNPIFLIPTPLLAVGSATGNIADAMETEAGNIMISENGEIFLTE